MRIGLFRKRYTVRRFGRQEYGADGYGHAAYTDAEMLLNVQPLTPNELKALPEGERNTMRLKAYGSDRLAAADEFGGTPGDRLFYNGLWHECTSSSSWEGTPLAHYVSKFALLPPHEQGEKP